VANFAAGGAAINQLARAARAKLRVVPLSVERPTADFTQAALFSSGDLLQEIRHRLNAARMKIVLFNG